MKSYFPASVRRQAASALVIVLAFVVLIAIVLVTYLASTQTSLKKSTSSASIVKTELLASAASAAIIDDFRQEMLAGAVGSALPGTNEPMVVTNAWAMVPGRVLSSGVSASDTNFVNLIKQSVRGSNFYPGTSTAQFTAKGAAAPATGRARASAVSTADSSLNGRLISAARWNQPMLLGGAGFTTTAQLPDWIYISRKGPMTNGAAIGDSITKAVTNDDYVIGRYAYNIYDIGGLIDINVAGYPSIAANEARKKGSPAWADMTAIPGITSSAAVEEYVKWRNKLSTDTSADYLKMVQDWGERRGFQKPYEQGGSMENRLFTRQDLIHYIQKLGGSTFTKDALPYLTTFSADLDEPSFTPLPNRPTVLRGSADGGNDARGKDSEINLNLALYGDAVGSGVIKRRFPLNRLRYLHPDPDPETEALILKHFGLVWNASKYAWQYNADGNSASIKKLSDISGREANFFELLQAAISVGSLGGQFENTNPQEPLESARQLGGVHGSVSYHIIKIAANIIDQYDADSYPTRILFDGREFYGDEDLPYLYLFRNAPYRTGIVTPSEITAPLPPEVVGQTVYRCVMMLQPTVWNPHAINPEAPAFNGPTNFRITGSTNGGDVEVKAREGWWGGTWVNNYPSTNPLDVVFPVQLDPNVTFMSFQTGAGKAAFREPYTLTSPNFPPGSAASGYVLETVMNGEEPNQGDDGSFPSTTVIGFRIGNLWGGPLYLPSDTSSYKYFRASHLENSGGMDFELQFLAPNGQYYTYDSFDSLAATNNPSFQEYPMSNRGRPIMRYDTKMDPRTNRFGYRNGNNYVHKTGTTDTYRHWLQGWTAWHSYIAGASASNFKYGSKSSGGDAASPNNVGWTYDAASHWQLIVKNTSTSESRYRDPDGVQRVAMGAESATGEAIPLITGNNDARPIILNRPFRSVAELGYAFRDQPWKQIDFWTPESGDAALLDVFSVYEPEDETAESIVSGRVNLNTRHKEVLEAMIRGVDRSAGSQLPNATAAEIAGKLTDWTASTANAKGPLRNRSELVGKFISGTTYSGFATELGTALKGLGLDGKLQLRRQNVLRALADGGTTRTWTFLIDLIVQDGTFPPTSAPDIKKFAVSGEKRYWIHISLDRFTGKVVAEDWEAVHE